MYVWRVETWLSHTHSLLVHTAAIMGDRRDWMYECFKKGGCHTSEWFAKMQMFLDHATVLSQIDNIRCPCNKCRNMTSHTKRQVTLHGEDVERAKEVQVDDGEVDDGSYWAIINPRRFTWPTGVNAYPRRFTWPTGVTIGIRGFVECWILCRVPFVGHSAKKALPSAALGKVRLSTKSLFTECWTLGTGPHSAKTSLPSVKHSAKGRQRPSQSCRPSVFAESQRLALGKESSLPSAT
jgi:hypothetical protein